MNQSAKTQRPLLQPAIVILGSLLAVPALWAQATPAPQAETEASTTTPSAEVEPADTGEEVIVLSPFVIDSTRDKGYYAQNTLAGSRMSTNVADLGSSISVITAQQFEDTASTDLNDIFRYEVNTEGSLTYTPGTQSMRNDGILDVNAGGTQGNSLTLFTNASANRVRGLGVPNKAVNYYPVNAAVPFDAYNTASVEINRGPNSLLFGLGNPAGIVNQSTAIAQIGKNSGRVSLRTDQYGSFRTAVSLNKTLVDDMLALYGAAVYDDRRFDREPAYDKTKRYYGAITFQPFSKTTLRANIEKYDNDNRRPNTITPRDYVTQWNLAGQPYYDPVTHRIMSLATGQQLSVLVNNANSPYAAETRAFIESRPGFNAALWNGARTQYNGQNVFGDSIFSNSAGFVAGSAPANNVLFVPGMAVVNQGRSIQQIANGELVNWFHPNYQYRYLTSWGTPTNPAANPSVYPAESAIWANSTWADYYTRSYTSSTGWTGIGNGILNTAYRYPSVTDRSIYDWRAVNVSSMNFGSAENSNYNIEIEQELPGKIFLNAGWFRQDYNARSNYTVAQLNVATLFVDTNINLPDGSPNPYFGKPYVEDQDPDSYINEDLSDHYRVMLAWTPDFTQHDGWVKWLGKHQILGAWTRDSNMLTNIRQRLHYTEAATDAGKYRYLRNSNNNADGSPTGWNRQTTSLRRTYYLAAPDDPNGVVTRAAGRWDHLKYTGDIQVYDYDSTGFMDVNMTQEFIDFDAHTGRNEVIDDSISAGMTSQFWDNRLVTTVGVRKDKWKARATNTGLPAVVGNEENSPAITNADKWVDGVYQRDLLFNRWGPWSRLEHTTTTLGGVLRPFRGWSSIESKADEGSLWGQFVRDFGVSYNKSDNFNPPSTALGDFFGNALPLPTGEGKDYGFQFALGDKLFARVTWFEATNNNENIPAPLVFGRLSSNVDETLFRNWARTIALINMGMDPEAEGFGTNLSTTQEQAVQDAAEDIWQLPYNYYASRPFAIGATRNAEAKGVEAEVNINPSREWTVKFTFGKQDTKYTALLRQYEPWYDVRYAAWQQAQAADHLLPQYQQYATYTTSGGREVDLTSFLTSFGYRAELFPESATGFDNPQAYYDAIVAPQLALDRDLEGQSVSGQRKYRWSVLSTYTFTSGPLEGFGVGGNLRWEDKSVIGYFGRTSGINSYNGSPVMDFADTSRPIYDSDNTYTDLWISYRRMVFDDRVGMRLQLNVNNVFEGGELRPVAVNYDGSPYSYRIIDPRQFILTATFDF